MSWAVGNSAFTAPLEELTAYLAQVTDRTTDSRLLGISWPAVGRIVEWVVTRQLNLICPPKTRPSPVLESGRGQDTKGEGTMAAPKRLSPAQIINRLRKAEVALANGNTTKEVCRELGVSEQTYYRWRREYGGMKLSQAKRLKEFEKENQQLKRAVAELTLDKLILKEASEGNF